MAPSLTLLDLESFRFAPPLKNVVDGVEKEGKILKHWGAKWSIKGVHSFDMQILANFANC